MSLLEDLYYRKICSSERICSGDPEYAQNNKVFLEHMYILQARLSPEDFTMIEEAMELTDLQIFISSASAYTLGFKMGAAMIIEVLEDKEELIQTKEKLVLEQIKLDRREL
ncbi:hypothetical protein GC101_03810 [Paenibacillus sp. LMG 31459]|uniref:Uncharacterized protein n=1 Tax=Paenibacillus phytohabitans TaxID=2654978 RepID=A0ABX1YDB7_9BACL|nr:DUF6809 family protein [Paenibacillus phytohabitans]NOU78001.1 hypothetical protein [Paenibacillus phytohabitans]